MKHAVVEIRDLAFAWPGHEAVLDLPALRIHEGERVFIKGPSGCGKSTLLGLLAGIQTANHGTLEVLGQPWPGFPAAPVTSSGRPIWGTSSSSSICCRFSRCRTTSPLPSPFHPPSGPA